MYVVFAKKQSMVAGIFHRRQALEVRAFINEHEVERAGNG